MIGATILGCAGEALSPAEGALFRAAQPWGFILFRRNIVTAEQTRRLCASLREAVGRDAPIFVDQEGGTVQRLRPPLARDWADASAQQGGPDAVRLRHRLMAAELRALGIDGNCAPVIDVAGSQTHPFLQRRIWGDDPDHVTRRASAAMQGLLDGGVLPVIKHVPGHGAANADSHHDLPRCDKTLDALERSDFVPVRALGHAPLAMTAHVVYSALDPDAPGTISASVIAHVRDVLGVRGLLMTDDIGMNALGGTMAERSAKARAAGCDIVLHCSGDLPEMEAVVGASGSLHGASLERAQKALAARVQPATIDIAALDAEFEALTRNKA